VSSMIGPYIEESVVWPYKNIGKLSIFVFITLATSIGYLICALLGEKIGENWRILMCWPILVSLTRLLVFLIIYRFETPFYLIALNKLSEAKKIIAF
jgi:putative effector of murein hydrolase